MWMLILNGLVYTCTIHLVLVNGSRVRPVLMNVSCTYLYAILANGQSF